MSRMRASTRRFALIAGLAALVLALAATISILVVMQSSFTMRRAAAPEAVARFEEVRRRFTGAGPLLEVVGNGHRQVVVHRERSPTSAAAVATVRGLAWRASDESLAEVRLPFWFVRMKLAGGRASLGALLPDGWDVVRVSADDLVRHGPGLLLDEQARNGDCLLLWAE